MSKKYKLECLCFSLLLSLMPALAYSQESPIDLPAEFNEEDPERSEVSNPEALPETTADSPANAAADSVDTMDEISVSQPVNEVVPDLSTATSAENKAVAPDNTSADTSAESSPAANSTEVNDTAEQSQSEESTEPTLSESHAATHEEDIDAVNQSQTEAADEAATPASRTSISEVDTGAQSQQQDTEGEVIQEPSADTTTKKFTGAKIPAEASGIRKGERRPEEQFTIDVFDRPLTIGGSFESFLNIQGDMAFDDSDDDYEFIDHSLSIEMFYEISDSISFFADGAMFYSKFDSDRQTGAERYQTWIYFEEIYHSDFDIKIGSQYFSDERTWWWDDDLDAITVEYWGERWQGEMAFTQSLARRSTTEDRLDPADEDLFRLLSRISWEHSDDHWLEIFYILHNDNSGTETVGATLAGNQLDDTDADLQWIGLRSYGYVELDAHGEIDYWLDTGYVDGDETFISTSDVAANPASLVVDNIENSTVRGWAIDLGLTWHTEFPLSPSFTLGYAVGSAKPGEQGSVEYAYQQTGIQGNSNYFTDVNYLSYYGELLYPELSNLRIWTLGVSVPLLENTALDLVYHQYDQYIAADFLYNAGLDIDPTGDSKDIGWEIDIIFRALEFIHWEYGITAAFFKAGDAFDTDAGEIATSLSFDLRYNF